MNVTIANVTCTSADTEYSVEMPLNTRSFSIQCRTGYDVRFAFVTGKVATPTAPYATVKKDWIYYEHNVQVQGMKLYLASPQAGVVVEVIFWG
jgi:hypothetical protein